MCNHDNFDRCNSSQSFKELYDEISNKNDSFYYRYNPEKKFDNLSFNDIKEFFNRGQKSEIVTPEIDNYYSNRENEDRIFHAFSVYFLGVYLYDNFDIIKTNINKILKKIKYEYLPNTSSEESVPEKLRYDFLYRWYLIALYHDLGYFVEKLDSDVDESRDSSTECDSDSKQESKDSIIETTEKTVTTPLTSTTPSTRFFKEKSLELQYSIKNNSWIPLSGLFAKSQKFKHKIPDILRNASTEYFKCRLTKTDKNQTPIIDHGFAAAYMLYFTMYKLHCIDTQKKGVKKRKINHAVNKNRLEFAPWIFYEHIVPIVWTIMCHNIWFYRQDNENDMQYCIIDKCLQENGIDSSLLQSLIIRKKDSGYNTPISLSKHPFLFLLDFVDTLEPSKRIDPTLSYCTIEKNENKIFISLDEKNVDKIKEQIQDEEQKQKIKPIESFMKLKDDLWFLEYGNFTSTMKTDDNGLHVLEISFF